MFLGQVWGILETSDPAKSLYCRAGTADAVSKAVIDVKSSSSAVIEDSAGTGRLHRASIEDDLSIDDDG